MQEKPSALGRIELVLLKTGLVLFVLYAVLRVDAIAGGAKDLAWFADTQPDTSLWSASRLDLYRSAAVAAPDPLAGMLIIRSLDLVVPLYADTSEVHLNRGVGLIEATALPGTAGNVGIAGHRDGYFRALKDIAAGAIIELRTRDRRYQYRVSDVHIVTRDDASLLRGTQAPTVTLVTCYPFYFVGSAPRRFVVRGTLIAAHGTNRFASGQGQRWRTRI